MDVPEWGICSMIHLFSLLMITRLPLQAFKPWPWRASSWSLPYSRVASPLTKPRTWLHRAFTSPYWWTIPMSGQPLLCITQASQKMSCGSACCSWIQWMPHHQTRTLWLWGASIHTKYFTRSLRFPPWTHWPFKYRSIHFVNLLYHPCSS